MGDGIEGERQRLLKEDSTISAYSDATSNSGKNISIV